MEAETIRGVLRAGVSGRRRALGRGSHRHGRPLPGDRHEPHVRRAPAPRPAPPRQRGPRGPARRRLDPRAPDQDERNGMKTLERADCRSDRERAGCPLHEGDAGDDHVRQLAAGASRRSHAAGAPVTTVDVLPDPRIRQELSALSGWPTIPQVFVKGELIGGADITEELLASGRVEPEARREARRRARAGRASRRARVLRRRQLGRRQRCGRRARGRSRGRRSPCAR